jgi:hypothetical protein
MVICLLCMMLYSIVITIFFYNDMIERKENTSAINNSICIEYSQFGLGGIYKFYILDDGVLLFENAYMGNVSWKVGHMSIQAKNTLLDFIYTKGFFNLKDKYDSKEDDSGIIILGDDSKTIYVCYNNMEKTVSNYALHSPQNLIDIENKLESIRISYLTNSTSFSN